MKYLLIIVLFVLGSTALASPFLDEARDTMLKCAFKEVKPEIVDHAYDKVGKKTRKRTKKKESFEEAVARESIGCVIKTIDSMLTYKKLFQ